jgi:SRSO17 transposase
VRASHRDYWRPTPRDEEWLLVDGPMASPSQSNTGSPSLAAGTPVDRLVQVAKMRWRIEREYQDLKQEFGLGHFKGTAGAGFSTMNRYALPPTASSLLSASEAVKKRRDPRHIWLTPGLRSTRLPSARSATYLTRSPRCAGASLRTSPSASSDAHSAVLRRHIL